MTYISPQNVRSDYNNRKDIWASSDGWHYNIFLKLKTEIERFLIHPQNKSIPLLLNAGSGNTSYKITAEKIINLDIANNKLKNNRYAVCASVEKLPFYDNLFDSCICVGSVVNYCNIIDSLREISRVLKPGGTLLLDTETTTSLEHCFTKKWNCSIEIVSANYNGGKEKIWLYSNKLIKDILKLQSFDIINIHGINIFPAFLCRLGMHENIACRFSKIDNFFRKIPFIRCCGSNLLILCRKR